MTSAADTDPSIAARCAVLGHPVGHSLSPALHRAAYAHLGLSWSYDAVDLDVDGLPAFIGGLDEAWRGLSLTMPLKRAVLPLLSESSDLVREVGACNTVILEDGRVIGHNTDVPGLVEALAELGVRKPASALVVGGGATAESAVAALRRMGVTRLQLAVRDLARSAAVVEQAEASEMAVQVDGLGTEWPDPVDVLVSTVPDIATVLIPDPVVERAGAVLDCLYDPWPTSLTVRARSAGVRVATGLDLLVHQAVGQIQLMTGRPVGVDVLRAALPAR